MQDPDFNTVVKTNSFQVANRKPRSYSARRKLSMSRIGLPLLALLVLVCWCLAGFASVQLGASDDYFYYLLKYAGEENIVISSG